MVYAFAWSWMLMFTSLELAISKAPLQSLASTTTMAELTPIAASQTVFSHLPSLLGEELACKLVDRLMFQK